MRSVPGAGSDRLIGVMKLDRSVNCDPVAKAPVLTPSSSLKLPVRQSAGPST
jgi:hypothetical protein